MDKFLFLIFFICVCYNANYAQNKVEAFDEEQASRILNDWKFNSDIIPSVLNSTQNALHAIVQYYGRHTGWSLRGNKESATIIDGVNWESPLKNWRLYDLYSGVQSELHLRQNIVSNAFSEYGYVEKSDARFLYTSINQNKKLMSFGSVFSNSLFSNSIQLHFNNDYKVSKWQYSFGVNFRQSPQGLLSNGYHQSGGAVLVFEKGFAKNNSIAFSLIWNWSDQGKSASTVNELFSLVQNRNYNPSWGWLQHQLYFPNTKQSNAPIFNLKYQKKWNEYKTLIVSNAIIMGLQSQSNLEWTKSADPRPDYYRYLPSYIKDSALRLALTQWDIQHPENLQIQFDKLEQINKGTIDHRSFYIVNQQNEKLLMMHGSLIFSNRINNIFGVQAGANYAFDQVHYYNTIKDLLGGSYYFNYNSWINDDGLEVSFQNDILNPDRKIKQGAQWGADYAIRAAQLRPWVQFEKEWPSATTRLSIGYGINGINRVGYNENGLFRAQSKGASDFIISPSWDFKEGFNYRFNGRLSVNSIVFGQWVAPVYEQLYINPEMNSISSPFKQTAIHYGFDFGLEYHAPALKIISSFYWKRVLNQSVQKMFYHDGYASFVYGIAGDINELYSGVESSVELNLLPNITLSLASTFQKSIYEKDPLYQLLFVNDLHVMESGLLHLKQMVSSNSPGLANAFAIKYQPLSTLQFNLTFLVAQNRPISIDLFRRSDLVQHKIDAISWGVISTTRYLADNSFLNASVFKSFQISKLMRLYKCRFGLVVNNAFNHFLPLIAYEQTRFDYLHFDTNKYAPKYLIDQGVAYTLHFKVAF